jgi:superfamily II DNA/RNA helicase
MHTFLTDPVSISVKSSDSLANIDQDVIKIGDRSKEEVLHQLLITKGFTKVLVFGGTKHKLNRLERNLKNRGHKVAAIHGNKNQNQRQRVLAAFKNNHLQALLATDVASRGLDIDDVTHVINFDLPQTYEDYIHRIGRTGRVDKPGVALTFVD